MKPTDFVGQYYLISYGSRTIKHYMDEDCVVSYFKGVREGIIIIKTKRKYIAYYYHDGRLHCIDLKEAIQGIESMRQPEILLTDEVIKRAVLEAL